MTARSDVRYIAVAIALTAAFGPGTLHGQAASPDRFAPIRHVNLGGDGAVWVGFGGQFRMRGEAWENFNFGAPAAANANDTFVLNRLLVSADLHLGTHARVFVQGKSALSSDRSLLGGRRVSDVDELDVQQAYAEAQAGAGGGALSLRAGRQDLAFGRERLVSPADWGNARRTFQGASSAWANTTSSVTAFWVRPVTVSKYDLNRGDSSTAFYGAYATRRTARANIGIDAYWVRLDRKGAAINGTAGQEQRHTVGARVWGPLRAGDRFDYDVEAAAQFGSIADTNAIRARFVAGQIGYAMPALRGARLYTGLDYGSGDRAAGGDVGTFSALFPSPHAYLGFIDVIGRQNALDLSAGASASRLWRSLGGQVDVHRFTRASPGDGIYNKLGAPITRTGPLANLPRSIGAELDVTVRYPVDRNLLLSSGWSRFWPGSFIVQSGPSRAINFSYVTAQYTL